MKIGFSPILIHADVKRAWLDLLMDEQKEDLTEITPSEDERASYGSDFYIPMMIAVSGIKYLMAGEVDLIYGQRTKVDIKNQTEKTVVDMPDLGNSWALNGNKSVSAQFLETILMAFFIRGAVHDVKTQRF